VHSVGVQAYSFCRYSGDCCSLLILFVDCCRSILDFVLTLPLMMMMLGDVVVVVTLA
jgi:hypothetical protein